MGFSTSAEWGRRFALWRVGRGGVSDGFIRANPPLSSGNMQNGQHLLAGYYRFEGITIEAQDRDIWDLAPPNPHWAEAIHSFEWLSDLAALGGRQARAKAQLWTQEWIARFGGGKGPGWALEPVSWRVLHMLHHQQMLLKGADEPAQHAYFLTLSLHARFLALHGHGAPTIEGRIAALCAALCACLALKGQKSYADTALRALLSVLPQIEAAGGLIDDRNPEAFARALMLLDWARQSLVEAHLTVPVPLLAALTRMVAMLRPLRHENGAFARFHGGGAGKAGVADALLAHYGAPPLAGAFNEYMGFARISRGRTSIIMDTAPPPVTPEGHASTLAFEATSGFAPLIVNCGSGTHLGEEWHEAARATPSHSTLTINGVSSSLVLGDGAKLAQNTAKVLEMEFTSEASTRGLTAAHDGWLKSHGVLHRRTIVLSADGERISGSDMLDVPPQPRHEPRETWFKRETKVPPPTQSPPDIGFTIRFHLHPETKAVLDQTGEVAALTLASDEVWLFRFNGKATLSLEPSVYLERGAHGPQASLQIVLSAQHRPPHLPIEWSLSKTKDGRGSSLNNHPPVYSTVSSHP